MRLTDTDKGSRNTHLEVLQATAVTSRYASMRRSREWGVLAFSSVCPSAVIARGKNSVALAAVGSPPLRRERKRTYLEIIHSAMITSRLTPPSLPLRLTRHVHLRVWNPDCELTVVCGLGGRL